MNTRPSDYAIVQAFRKRPVVIEAAGPITAVNFLAISQWCGGQAKTSLSIIIPTLEGDMRAEAGDWIIKGVKGEFYPCKPDIFAATYEPAEIDAARPEQVQDCRGYAHLGTGQYLINHSASGEPAELCISIATEEEKAGRVVGDSRDNAPGNLIQPESMVVRLRFENVDGLDALEHQLRLLRQVHFPCPTAEREDSELTTEHARALQDIPKPEQAQELHPATSDLVDRFAVALKEKLAAAEQKYGWDTHWQSPSWMDQCREQLIEHVAKGDPRDVAAYCAFLWHHGESTAPSEHADDVEALDDAELVDRALQNWCRSVMYDTKDQHDYAHACRTEILRRLAAKPQDDQDRKGAMPKLIGWRTDNYLMETSDPAVAKNWESHYRMLPIFEGDPNTKLDAAMAQEAGP